MAATDVRDVGKEIHALLERVIPSSDDADGIDFVRWATPLVMQSKQDLEDAQLPVGYTDDACKEVLGGLDNALDRIIRDLRARVSDGRTWLGDDVAGIVAAAALLAIVLRATLATRTAADDDPRDALRLLTTTMHRIEAERRDRVAVVTSHWRRAATGGDAATSSSLDALVTGAGLGNAAVAADYAEQSLRDLEGMLAQEMARQHASCVTDHLAMPTPGRTRLVSTSASPAAHVPPARVADDADEQDARERLQELMELTGTTQADLDRYAAWLNDLVEQLPTPPPPSDADSA